MSLRNAMLLYAMVGLGGCALPPGYETAPEQARSRLQTESPGCREEDDPVTCLRRFTSTPPRTFTARADCSVFTERSDSVTIEPTTRAARPARFPATAREGGRVHLQMRVEASGRLAGIRVLESSGHPQLAEAAMAAARDWCYLPAHRDGRDTGGDVEAWFHFNVVTWPQNGNAPQEEA
ncbi:energy transducer TonB family protein [Stenotrophomonas maltophilia]|uniref:energy transducer TonB family protein n=1 Tax=Stenotrophomonas maltophilia TaxID=40324 RepID=UPI0022F39A29|nr:TonB family protein [Stenotrophomonas maltophilia]